MAENSNQYYAIDSDVLHDLVYVEFLQNKYGFIDKNKIPNKLIRDNFGYFFSLINMAKNDEIRLLIVPTVFHECEHSKSCVEFMKNYCYMQNVNQFNADRIAQEVDDLAKSYCKSYVYNGVEFPAPMMNEYSSANRKYVPSNDAYIMAEATIAGAAAVITMNVKHYIKNIRNDDDDNSRLKGIIRINKIKGYQRIFQNEDGVQYPISTVPKALYAIMPIIRNKTQNRPGVFVKTSNGKMAKVSELVDEDELVFGEDDVISEIGNQA